MRAWLSLLALPRDTPALGVGLVPPGVCACPGGDHPPGALSGSAAPCELPVHARSARRGAAAAIAAVPLSSGFQSRSLVQPPEPERGSRPRGGALPTEAECPTSRTSTDTHRPVPRHHTALRHLERPVRSTRRKRQAGTSLVLGLDKWQLLLPIDTRVSLNIEFTLQAFHKSIKE